MYLASVLEWMMTMHTIVTDATAALIDFTDAAKRKQVGVAPVERH